MKFHSLKFLSVIFVSCIASSGLAIQAQSVPIPEDPSVEPQVNISGAGIASMGYSKNSEVPEGKADTGFSDSALQIGASQQLFEGGGVGGVQLGWVTTDATNKGTGNPFFLHQAFVSYQDEKYDVVFGRTDNPVSHVVDFPTLRSDDLYSITTPLNPLSNGGSAEEHRYSNVASFTVNQNLSFYENIHAQRLINSADTTADNGFNSYGASFAYLGTPGFESVERLNSVGVGYEQIVVNRTSAKLIHEGYAGAVIGLNESVVNRIELGVDAFASSGSDLKSFTSVTDTFEADSRSAVLALRCLYSPFGRPSGQISLTVAQKEYSKVDDAKSTGAVLTLVRRLGHGFDLVGQYTNQWRSNPLAAIQTSGLAVEQKVEVGFAFNFDATINEHIAPRRRLLNQKHQFISN